MHSHKISTPTGTPVPDEKVKELSSEKCFCVNSELQVQPWIQHLPGNQGGYVVMTIYHHGAADGTSGLAMLGQVMKHYKLLEEGQELDFNPQIPREPMEDLCKGQLAKQACLLCMSNLQ